MATPKVSVIIPTFNYAKYLTDAIDSILSQTYQDFEIIVVDDGSEDNTREIVCSFIKQYSQKTILYFYQENKGISAARNKGINEAKGEYIIFLDSDDVWFPWILEEEVKFLNNHKEIGVVSSWMVYCNEFGKMIPRLWRPKSGLSNFRLVPLNQHPSGTSLIRMSALRENNFKYPEAFKKTQDYYMWLLLSRKTKLVVLPQFGFMYRLHGNNFSGGGFVDTEHKLAIKNVWTIDGDLLVDVFATRQINTYSDLKRAAFEIKKILVYFKKVKFLTFVEKIKGINEWDKEIFYLFLRIKQSHQNFLYILPLLNMPITFIFKKLLIKCIKFVKKTS